MQFNYGITVFIIKILVKIKNRDLDETGKNSVKVFG